MSKNLIFISYTNKDENSFTLAKKVYESLSSVFPDQVFFSPRTIEKQSNSNFRTVIDENLRDTTTLILVATENVYIHEGWIKYECDTFSTMINSGLKPAGEMFVIYKNISVPADLPTSLINAQCYCSDNLSALVSQLKVKYLEKANKETIYDFTSRMIAKNDSGFNALRENLYNQITNFLVSDKQCCFIYGDHFSGVSTFLVQLAKRFVESKSLIYSDNIDECSAFILNNEQFLKDIKYAFIDNVDTKEELDELFVLVKKLPDAKFVIPIDNVLRAKVADEVKKIFSFDLVKVGRLTYNEIDSLLLEKLDQKQANEIINFVRRFDYDFLYNFKTIIAISNLVVNYDDVDFNAMDLIDVISKIYKDSPEVKEEKNQLFDSLYNGCSENFHKIPVGNNTYENLLKVSYLQYNISSYSPISVDLFNYDFAKYLHEKEGIDQQSIFNERFYGIEAFYLALIYKESKEDYEKLDLSKARISDIFAFLDLVVINPKDLTDIARNPHVSSYYLDYISLKIELGSTKFAEDLINQLEILHFANITTADIEALRLWLSYHSGEDFEINPEYLSNKRYAFYCAEVAYFSDDYLLAKKYFNIALKDKQINTFSNKSIYIPYIEFLNDTGKARLIRKTLKKIKKIPNLTKLQLAQIEDIEGFINMCMGNYSEAINKYNRAISIIEKTSYESVQTKFYGDFSYLYILVGDYEKALQYNSLNLDYCKAKNLYNGLAVSHHYRGLICFLSGQYNEAYKYFSIGLMYSDYAKNKWRNIALRLNCLLLPYSLKNVELFDLSSLVDDIESIDSGDLKAYAYSLLSLVYYFNFKDVQKAKSYLKIAKTYENDCNEEEQRKLINNIELLINNKQLHNKKSNCYSTKLILALQDIHAKEKELSTVVPFREFDLGDIYLTKILPSCAVDIFEYASDPETTKYMIWETHKSLLDTFSFIEGALKKEIETSYLCWGIEHNGKIIGMVDMTFNEDHNRYEIGYILNKAYWNKGIMTKAAITVINYFRSCGVNQFVGVPFIDNIASRRVLEKCGFKKVKELKRDSITEYIYYLDF